MLFIIYEWSCHMSSSEHASFVCLLLTNETLYGHPPGFVIHTGRGYHALGRILKFLSWLTNLLVQQGQPTASSHLRSHPKLSLIMYDSLQKSWCRPEVKRSSTAPVAPPFIPNSRVAHCSTASEFAERSKCSTLSTECPTKGQRSLLCVWVYTQ